jgi:outer membrane protein assembly factor BamB
VAAGGLILFAGDDGAVRALDAATGQPRWTVRTGGEIRIPPTIADGRALFGSGDGWVSAVEAATGRLLWRFRAAPTERRIPVYGTLLSTWPAASGVLVADGTAYVAAGLANYDGTYVYALDAATGQVKWCNDASGHLDAEAKTGVSVQGHLLLNEDTLYLAGGNAVSPAAYDTQDGSCLNESASLARCESTSPRGWELFLVGDRVIACGPPMYQDPNLPVYDHTVTSKLLHVPGESRDVVWIDNQVLAGFAPLDKQELNRCVTDERIARHVTQNWGKFRVTPSPVWRWDCPGSVAVAVAANCVVVADGKTVRARSLDQGRPLWSHALPASPVPWGLAIDGGGSVVLTLVDGSVLCFGE